MVGVRSWLIGLRASRSYAFVLLLVVIGFVFAATAPDERWSIGVLLLIQSVALMIALWTSRAAPLGLRIAIPVRGDRGGRCRNWCTRTGR